MVQVGPWPEVARFQRNSLVGRSKQSCACFQPINGWNLGADFQPPIETRSLHHVINVFLYFTERILAAAMTYCDRLETQQPVLFGNIS